jgi:hypothetical protein
MRVWDKPEARKRSQEPLDRRIHILNHEPKRAGSASDRRWRSLREGMTIGQYYRAVRRIDEDVHLARVDISYGVEAGFIELLPPLAR